jgi:hypothetical protein
MVSVLDRADALVSKFAGGLLYSVPALTRSLAFYFLAMIVPAMVIGGHVSFCAHALQAVIDPLRAAAPTAVAASAGAEAAGTAASAATAASLTTTVLTFARLALYPLVPASAVRSLLSAVTCLALGAPLERWRGSVYVLHLLTAAAGLVALFTFLLFAVLSRLLPTFPALLVAVHSSGLSAARAALAAGTLTPAAALPGSLSCYATPLCFAGPDALLFAVLIADAAARPLPSRRVPGLPWPLPARTLFPAAAALCYCLLSLSLRLEPLVGAAAGLLYAALLSPSAAAVQRLEDSPAVRLLLWMLVAPSAIALKVVCPRSPFRLTPLMPPSPPPPLHAVAGAGASAGAGAGGTAATGAPGPLGEEKVEESSEAAEAPQRHGGGRSRRSRSRSRRAPRAYDDDDDDEYEYGDGSGDDNDEDSAGCVSTLNACGAALRTLALGCSGAFSAPAARWLPWLGLVAVRPLSAEPPELAAAASAAGDLAAALLRERGFEAPDPKVKPPSAEAARPLFFATAGHPSVRPASSSYTQTGTGTGDDTGGADSGGSGQRRQRRRQGNYEQVDHDGDDIDLGDDYGDQDAIDDADHGDDHGDDDVVALDEEQRIGSPPFNASASSNVSPSAGAGAGAARTSASGGDADVAAALAAAARRDFAPASARGAAGASDAASGASGASASASLAPSATAAGAVVATQRQQQQQRPRPHARAGSGASTGAHIGDASSRGGGGMLHAALGLSRSARSVVVGPSVDAPTAATRQQQQQQQLLLQRQERAAAQRAAAALLAHRHPNASAAAAAAAAATAASAAAVSAAGATAVAGAGVGAGADAAATGAASPFTASAEAATAPPLPYAAVPGLTTHSPHSHAAAATAAATAEAALQQQQQQQLGQPPSSSMSGSSGGGGGGGGGGGPYAALAENLVMLGHSRAAAEAALMQTGGHVGAAVALLSRTR